MSKKALIFLEVAWLVVGILCVAAGIRSLIYSGGNRFLAFFLMALISFAMAWFRNNQRKKSNFEA